MLCKQPSYILITSPPCVPCAGVIKARCSFDTLPTRSLILSVSVFMRHQCFVSPSPFSSTAEDGGMITRTREDVGWGCLCMHEQFDPFITSRKTRHLLLGNAFHIPGLLQMHKHSHHGHHVDIMIQVFDLNHPHLLGFVFLSF